MKRIGFLSFGHWRAAPGSQTRTASDALLQTIELAQAAEDLGVDGAFVRVHHFERQLASPFPLLADNARILGTIARHIAPAFGWTPADAASVT